MTPEIWSQVTEIFLAALETPAHERAAFLQHTCTDPALRKEVERLLQTEGGPELESPLGRILGPRGCPARIGRYRIIRLIGEGGMGVVYEAEQDQPRRRVAIKAIKTGFAGPELLRRFGQEAEALGRLQHPGIARIYEAGAADTGFGPQPYFAMEFIEGAPLVRYAEEHRLDLRQRLDLMVKVCDAVHHAHQRGIIHRDLKPGNILVEASGEPRIVDFGVARATDANALATGQTGFGQILGTLAYMSPEQVLADPLEVDTRSDVYALGVILYELLAGRLPYRIGDSLPAAIEVIREEDPVRLGSINRVFRGDLETIAAKALEKDKTRRYASAAELAGDIRLYLRNQPIAARPSTAAYYLRKFARRHRALVASLAVVLAALIAGIALSTWEAARALRAEAEALRQRDAAALAQRAAQQDRDRAVRAEQTATVERNRAIAERKHADNESATATAISEFLQRDLLEGANVLSQSRNGERSGPDLKMRTVLDRAAASIAGRFDKQPLVEAAIRHTIAGAYWGLEVYPQARGQAARALELRRKALGEEHRDSLKTMLLLGMVYRAEGNYAEAEALLTRVADAMGRKMGQAHPETLVALAHLAGLYHAEGKLAQAEQMGTRVWKERRRALGPDNFRTLESANDLGSVFMSQGRYAEAGVLLSETLEAFRRVLAPDAPDTLATAENLANVYVAEKKYQAAESLLTDTIDRTRRVFGGESGRTLNATSTLARVYSNSRRYAEAEALYGKVVDVRRRVSGENHPDTLKALNNLAVLFSREGKHREAADLLSRIFETNRRLYGEDNRVTLSARGNLGGEYAALGQADLAERLLRENVAATRRVLGDRHPMTLNSSLKLASVYRNEGKYGEAESLSRSVLDAHRGAHGAEHADTLAATSLLAGIYLDEGNSAAAETLLVPALEASRRVLGPAHATTANCAFSLGRLRMDQHRYAEAEALLRGAVEPLDNEPSSWRSFERRAWLGLCLMEQSKFAEAEPLLTASYRGLAQSRLMLPVRLSPAGVGEWIVDLYTRWGKPGQAAQCRNEIRAASQAPSVGSPIN